MSSRDEYPEIGDLVVASVRRVTDYGAYISLDEYDGKEGLIHISEISTTWVRNIRDHVRAGQKLVSKVLRVNPSRNQIDLSLRRVSGREKIEKMLQWKMDKKASSIIKAAAEKLKGSNKMVKDIKDKIHEGYESLYDAFEDAVESGPKVLEKLNVPSDWSQTLTEAARTKIKIQEANRSTIMELTNAKQNGIDAVKESLIKAKKVRKSKRAEIKIYTVGAPKYRIDVSASDYGSAEELLNRVVEEALSSIKELDGEGRRLS